MTTVQRDLIPDDCSLTRLTEEHVAAARDASAGRSAHTVYGGREHHLRQTLVALRAGSELSEHESPGEATLQVLHGRVALVAGDDRREATEGDLMMIPASRHSLEALEDCAVLLTVVTRVS
jgi:quercetin dioxygenase-like cupin family protein